MANKVDATIPQNSESPTLGAQRIRETRSGFNALLTAEHDISDDATTSGFHGTNVTGKVDTSISTPPSGYGRFGWKTISGVAELFYRDDAGNEQQITSGGGFAKLLINGTLDVTGNIDPTTYETTRGGFQNSDTLAGAADNKIASSDSILKFATLDADGVLMHDSEGAFQNADVNGTKTKVYTKYLTGTMDNDSGTNVAHGVSGGLSNILNVAVSIFEDTGFSGYVVWSHRDTAAANVAYQLLYNDTVVALTSVGSQLQGNTYKIKIDYKLP